MAGFAGLAVHEGVGEAAEMPRSLPCARIHQNGAIYARIMGIFLYEFFPPRLFDVIFQLHAQRTVVPGIGETAVNFASGKNEAPVFAKGNEFFHRHRSLFSHIVSPVMPRRAAATFFVTTCFRESNRGKFFGHFIANFPLYRIKRTEVTKPIVAVSLHRFLYYTMFPLRKSIACGVRPCNFFRFSAF